MNREDIIRMALETMPYEDGNYFVVHSEELERFAALVAAAERDACILALERSADKTLEEIIAAIRARGRV